MAWSPVEPYILAAGTDSGAIAIWDTRRESFYVLRAGGQPVNTLAWAADGRHLLSIDHGQSHLWPVLHRDPDYQSFLRDYANVSVKDDRIAAGAFTGLPWMHKGERR